MVRPKRSRVPKRPYDKDRLIDEMKLVGTYGLKNKRELWIVMKECDETKNRARDLLICLNEEKQIVDGRNPLNKLVTKGILPCVNFQNKSEIIDNLNQVLNLTASNFLERRLQYRVFDMGIVNDVHQARCLIFQKQIAVKGNMVNKPGFPVSAEDEGHIEVYVHSTKAGARVGRIARKNKGKYAYEEGGDEE